MSSLSPAEAARLTAAQLATNPAAARQRDRNGRLPLHHALLTHSPDAAVVLALLEAYPNGASQQDQMHDLIALREEVGEIHPDDEKMLEGFGKWPLHLAVEHGASMAVLQALVAAAPAALEGTDNVGRLPLHLAAGSPTAGPEAVELLLAATPPGTDALATRGKDTPLHLAAGRAVESPAVVAALIKARPEWCKAADAAEELPLHKAAGSLNAATAALLLEAYPDGARSMPAFGGRAEKRSPLHTACASYTLSKNTGKSLSAVALPLLEAFPEAAERADTYGSFPLQIVASETRKGRVEYEVLEALIKAYPAAASAQAYWDKRTPLHMIMEDAVKGDEERDIGDEDGDADDETEEPIHNISFLHAVECLLEAAPGSASVRDLSGNLPLHAAATQGASLEVIERLLDVYPEAICIPGQDGMLPVHAALHYHRCSANTVLALLSRDPSAAGRVAGPKDRHLLAMAVRNGEASAFVVESLLEENTDAAMHRDADGLLPLHLVFDPSFATDPSLEVVRLLLDYYPVAAEAADERNWRLPLHMSAAAQGLDAKAIVGALLLRYPEAVSAEDKQGQLPLDLAVEYASPALPMLLAAMPEAAERVDSDGRLPLHRLVSVAIDEQFGGSKLTRSLLAAYPEAASTRDNDGHLPLDLAIESGAGAAVVSCLLGAYPEGARQESTTGQMPLHVAVAAADHLVQPLMKAFPAAARHADAYGMLPLHLALDKSTHNKETVRALASAFPEGLRRHTGQHELPLSIAIRRDGAPGVVAELLPSPQAVSAEEMHLLVRHVQYVGLVKELVTHRPDLALTTQRSTPNAPPPKAARRTTPPAEAQQQAEDDPSARLSGAAASTASPPTPPGPAVPQTMRLGVEAEHPSAAAAGDAPSVGAGAHAAGAKSTAPEEAAEPAPGRRAGRSALDAAEPAVRDAMRAALLFLRRYRLEQGKPAHRSATCVVVFAEDETAEAGTARARVALKLMRDPGQFLKELRARRRHGLAPEFVVDVLRVHVEDAAVAQDVPDGIHATVEAAVGAAALPWEPQAPEQAAAPRLYEYRYCVVMERADRNLAAALMHERFAGQDWDLVRSIGGDLAQALGHLHSRDLVHADLKPLNTVRVGEAWRLIDMDVACEVGDAFGAKPPSSGYCPPEMARVLLAAAAGGGGGGGSPCAAATAVGPLAAALQSYTADVSHDLWSFGAVLFYMATGRSLWHVDQDDNVSQKDLQKLARWDSGARMRRLAPLFGSNRTLYDLLHRLLEPGPQARLGHFEAGVESVRLHPFFQAADLDTATLSDIRAQLVTVNTKLDEVLRRLNAQVNMLCTLLGADDKRLPGLVCFLPPGKQASERWWQRLAAKPSDWLNTPVDLFFVDPVTMRLAGTNGGRGFRLQFSKAWVVKAVPYLRAGMTALRLAAAAGRLAGFPVPDFVAAAKGMLDQQLALLDSLSGDAADYLSRHTGLDGQGVMDALLQGIEAASAGELQALQATADGANKPPPAAMLQFMRKSAEELRELLAAQHPSWERSTGLVRATCRQDGHTEWVLPEYKSDFEARGGALLGTESAVQDGVVEGQNALLHSRAEEIAALQQEVELLRSRPAAPPPAGLSHPAAVTNGSQAPPPLEQPDAPAALQVATSLACIEGQLESMRKEQHVAQTEARRKEAEMMDLICSIRQAQASGGGQQAPTSLPSPQSAANTAGARDHPPPAATSSMCSIT